jgi:hypothetical protein
MDDGLWVIFITLSAVVLLFFIIVIYAFLQDENRRKPAAIIIFANLIIAIALIAVLFVLINPSIGEDAANIALNTTPEEREVINSETAAPPSEEPTIIEVVTPEPTTLPTPSPRRPDFLDDKTNKELLYPAIRNYKYEDLLLSVDKYIENNIPDKSDNAYNIKELIQPAIKALKGCVIKHDSFEDSYSIFYKGIESISKDINIVPSMENGYSSYRVGFKKSNWLFFNKISIKTSTGEFIEKNFNSFDMQRDVLSGGTVLEYIDLGFHDNELTMILNSDSITIRFINTDNEKHYDHKLSGKELAALKAIITLEITNAALTDLTFYKNLD